MSFRARDLVELNAEDPAETQHSTMAQSALQIRTGRAARPAPGERGSGHRSFVMERFLRELALLEPEPPVGLVRQRPVVGDHQDGGVVVAAE